MGVINETEKKVAHNIREVRNNFIHRKKGYQYLIGTKANVEYQSLVKKVIQILKEKLNLVRITAFP